MRKFLFCPLQRDMFEDRRDGGDKFSNSGFSVGVWRRSEVQRNVVFELSASDATRCSPIKAEMQRGVAVELHIFRNYEARTSSSATPNGRTEAIGDQLPVGGRPTLGAQRIGVGCSALFGCIYYRNIVCGASSPSTLWAVRSSSKRVSS